MSEHYDAYQQGPDDERFGGTAYLDDDFSVVDQNQDQGTQLDTGAPAYLDDDFSVVFSVVDQDQDQGTLLGPADDTDVGNSSVLDGSGADADGITDVFNGDLSSAGDNTLHMPTFDPAEEQWDGAGDPAADMEHWHQQEEPDTCAIASQEFVLDSLTGQGFSEEQLRAEAEANGWYTPGGGTPQADTGKLLEAHGLDVEREQGATIDELSSALADGEKVIVGVNAEKIWASGTDSGSVDEYPGIPGQGADHAVEVIGMEQDSPNGPIVVLNDPGHPDGKGMIVPLDEFQAAWQDSGDFAVIAAPGDSGQPGAHGTVPSWPQGPSFGGYYNADGTYHWESDNTDRDPNTGAIVRQW